MWRRLWGATLARPWWQRAITSGASLWWTVWIGDVFLVRPGPRTPIGTLIAISRWAGASGSTWLDAVSGWLREPEHRTFLVLTAWAAGAVWAAAGERAPLPASVGWLVVLASSEGLGYAGAARRAALGLGAVVAVFAVLALPWRRRMIDRRARFVPGDVALAGVKAAALVVLAALYLPGRAVTLVCAPYLTRPPAPNPDRPAIPVLRDPTNAITKRSESA